MKRLEGKATIVTGGGQGIGRAIAETFAREGAMVWIPDVRKDNAEAVAAGICGKGGQAWGDLCDIADEASVKAMVDRAVAKMGKLDILVNNAGVELCKSIEEMTLLEWNRLMAVNVGGMFLCCKYAVPHFKKQGRGNIINLSSAGGYRGVPFNTAYCASKGAVQLFTKALALECGPAGVKVNAIAPGGIDTPMLDYLDSEFKKRGMDVKRYIDTQFGGMGRPQDIADLALFLASDESRIIHGAALPIDGGSTAG